MEQLIFDKIFSLISKYKTDKIHSSSVEVKIVGSNSVFYFSLLVNQDYVLNEGCDEIVIEVNSKDGIYYDMDISDSSGVVYYEVKQARENNEINDFIDKSHLVISGVLSKMSKIN